jgi:hypothetical protein
MRFCSPQKDGDVRGAAETLARVSVRPLASPTRALPQWEDNDSLRGVRVGHVAAPVAAQADIGLLGVNDETFEDEAAVAYYRNLNFRIERVMTDNGSCYRSKNVPGSL